jgi:tRNA-splicing ligase RtcB
MMFVYKLDTRLPIMIWMNKFEDLEQGALDQAINLGNLPFAVNRVCLMPDTHQGYGMPIGGVLATKDYIIPNAVGVDIGCGMCAVKTTIRAEELPIERLKKILGRIRQAIPVGFNKHAEKQSKWLMPLLDEQEVVGRQYQAALYQLGTLGGGNHFIEIQKDQDGYVWVMIHSGSRNLGYTVANHYNKLAISLNEKWCSAVPSKHELAYFPIDSDEGEAYLAEMDYCVDFAFANRKFMMVRVVDIIYDEFKWNEDHDEMINIAHNYAVMEHHFGKNVMVHRKGATRARENEIGIIPGSQGTKSYIVKGKGEKASFESCSHGAGRRMSRKQAKNELDLEQEIKTMDEMGIVHGMRHTNDLDEAAGAYKDIEDVMKNQADLVEIVTELEPMGVIKG